MEKNFFEVGDVVLLKGNDVPAMTVTSIPRRVLGETHVACMWFDGATLLSGNFHQDTLDIREDKF